MNTDDVLAQPRVDVRIDQGDPAELLYFALGLDKLSNHFAIDLRPVDAQVFAMNCTDRGIAPERLAALIGWINGISPVVMPNLELNRHADPEPYPAHLFTIGKEYRRVLYVFYPKQSWSRKIDWDTLAHRICWRAQEMGAEEVKIVEDDRLSLKIRMWWE